MILFFTVLEQFPKVVTMFAPPADLLEITQTNKPLDCFGRGHSLKLRLLNPN